jgi:hypothetical protein
MLPMETLDFRTACFYKHLYYSNSHSHFSTSYEFVWIKFKHVENAHLPNSFYWIANLSVVCFIPGHFQDSPPKIFIRSYAVFGGWLILSLPLKCLRERILYLNLTKQLGTLKIRLGCCPLDLWSSSPKIWLQLFYKNIRSLFWSSNFRKP